MSTNRIQLLVIGHFIYDFCTIVSFSRRNYFNLTFFCLSNTYQYIQVQYKKDLEVVVVLKYYGQLTM